MKILIIDDEMPIRQYIEHCVRSAGAPFEVCGVVPSARKALEVLAEKNIDLALVDITMPKMSGLELLKIIKEDYHHTSVVMLTCHDDFNFARTSMQLGAEDYILKSEINEREMAEFLNKFLSIHKKNQLSGKMTEHLKRNEYLEKIIHRSDIKMEDTDKLIKNKIFLDDAEFFSIAFDSTPANLENICEHMPKYFLNPILFSYSVNTLILLTNIKSCAENVSTAQLLNNYKKKVLSICDGNIGVSDIYFNLSRMKQAMLQALKDKNLKFYGSELNQNKESMNGEQGRIEVQILTADSISELRNGNVSSYATKIQKCLNIALNTNNLDESFLKESLILSIKGYSLVREDQECYINSVERAEGFSALNKIIEDFLDMVKSENRYYSDVISTTIEYIKDLYNTNISLTDIAGELHFNSEYVSRQFKKEVGINFTEYLNTIRMEEAKKLILNSNMKISDIALEVGIDNPSYFSSLFNKFYGISPNNLRKHGKNIESKSIK